MQPDELKAIRKAAGMTQQAFADAMGMSRKAINEMENGAAKIETRTERAAQWIADVRVSVCEMGDDFVVVVTERIEGLPGRSHRVLAPAMSREKAIAKAKALADETGCQFISAIY